MKQNKINRTLGIILLFTFVLASSVYSDTYAAGTTFTPPLSNVTYTLIQQLTCDYLNVTDYCLIITGGSLAGSYCHNSTTNTTYDLTKFSIVFRDEITNEKITWANITLEYISGGYTYNYTTDEGGLVINLTSSENYTMRYWSDDYGRKRQYLFRLSNTSVNTLDLYLLNNSLSDDLTITVYDQLTIAPIENSIVYLLRYNQTTNVYKTVAMYRTDVMGQAYFDVERKNELYVFMVDSPWTVRRLQTTANYIESATLSLYILLQDPIAQSFLDEPSIQYTPYYLNTSNKFQVSYTDSDLKGSNFCLYVKRYGYYGTQVLNTSCSTSNTGILELSGTAFNDTYAVFTATLSGDERVITSIWKFYNPIEPELGAYGIFLNTILIMILSFMSGVHILAFILALTGLIFGKLLHVITLSWGYVLGIYATGLIVVMIVRMYSRK